MLELDFRQAKWYVILHLTFNENFYMQGMA